MARAKKDRASGNDDFDDVEVGAAVGSAAERDGSSDEDGDAAGASRHRTRPSWESPVETGINGYRGSGG